MRRNYRKGCLGVLGWEFSQSQPDGLILIVRELLLYNCYPSSPEVGIAVNSVCFTILQPQAPTFGTACSDSSRAKSFGVGCFSSAHSPLRSEVAVLRSAIIILIPTLMVKGSSYLLSLSFPYVYPSSQGTTGGANHGIVMPLLYTNYQVFIFHWL